jgi:hypothetical protein
MARFDLSVLEAAQIEDPVACATEVVGNGTGGHVDEAAIE